MTVLLIVAGAAAGAPLRYLTDRFVQQRHDSIFPWGTFAVNVVGCLILGLVTAIAVPTWVVALVGTGFCGTLTTYSTFGYETVALAHRRARLLAVANVVASVAAGLGAALLGHAVGTAIAG